jgi:membrane-associated phospholipid phosphatase
MQDINRIIKKTQGFILPYIVLIFICILILLFIPKADIHIWSNQHNSSFCDLFFKTVTFFGDGLFIIIVTVLLLLWRIRYSILVFSTYAISGILVQILKRIVHAPRPKLYFEGIYDLHFVEGVKMYTTNSFPSGHSASAFALFLCFALFVKNKWLQLVFVITASLIAYSRIYLSQHFLIDITVGSAFGIIIVLLCAWYMERFKNEWLDKPIYMVLKTTTKQ